MSNKQTDYQQRHRELGLCILCPLPVSMGSRCEKHYALQLSYGKKHYKKRKQLERANQYENKN